MLVIANHTIQNADSFWSTAKSITNMLPSNLKLYSVYASTDKKWATCIWECNSVQEVQKFIDSKLGNYCKTNCYEVNQTASIGLPKIAMTVEAIHN